MSNYYNENDPLAAAALRQLIKAGAIEAGDVDERSIIDVQAEDLKGYTQCHFFAGIGGWPFALAIASVRPDVPLWTGSCPCQPLSSAGKREGEMDERHLWPVWYSLIAECRPDEVYGEQTASGDGPEWLDGISLDLEELGYAIGAGDLPAACVGAPDIRQRLWWVADARCSGDECERGPRETSRAAGTIESQAQQRQRGGPDARNFCKAGGMADANSQRLQKQRLQLHQWAGRQAGKVSEATGPGEVRGVGDAERARLEGRARHGDDGNEPGRLEPGAHRSVSETSAPDNFWSDFELCWRRKTSGGGEWCRIEPGTFPLDSRLPENVGLLRGYGNSINPWVAAKFIRAHVEASQEKTPANA